MSENKENNKRKEEGPAKKKPFNFFWVYGVLGFLVVIMLVMQGTKITTPTSEGFFFETMMKNQDVEKVEVVTNKLKAEIYLKEESVSKPEYEELKDNRFALKGGPHYSFDIATVENFKEKFDEAQKDLPADQQVPWSNDNRQSPLNLLGWLIFPLLLIGFWIFMFRRMGSGGVGGGSQIFNIGKSKAKLFDQNENVNVTFKDVAGLDEAKEEVMEIVDFLRQPEKYKSLGGKIPKGALLIGPPGTGKTLMAKAMAGEAKVPFFSISGSDFVEMFVGVGASRVRDLFKQAREKAPCIIFIDEIDAIGRARGGSRNMGGNDERENTLNQLLVEMDGFDGDKGVILLAGSTNPRVCRG